MNILNPKKFVIRKSRPIDRFPDLPWTVWLPPGQRWIQSDNGRITITAQGAGVASFDAAREFVTKRLAEMNR